MITDGDRRRRWTAGAELHLRDGCQSSGSSQITIGRFSRSAARSSIRRTVRKLGQLRPVVRLPQEPG